MKDYLIMITGRALDEKVHLVHRQESLYGAIVTHAKSVEMRLWALLVFW